MAYGNVALVVEDDPLVRRALARELSSIGFICESASSLREAKFLSGPWKVAIVDLDLPDGSGLALTQEAGGAELCPLRIFFSASEDTSIIARALELGDFISKSEGIGAVLKRIQTKLEAPAGPSHVPEPPVSGARAVARTPFEEPASSPINESALR